MLAPRCTVVHDGSRKAMDASQLVIGDIVFIQSGDRVPADIRMLSCTDLQVSRRKTRLTRVQGYATSRSTLSPRPCSQILESMLTGQSLAATKITTPVAPSPAPATASARPSPTLAQQGQGTGLVVATGDPTAIGSINALVQGEAEKPSSLQVQLELFGSNTTNSPQ